jgi:uncharacterized protein YdeI (YjbR/CyaY-like superfamily)
MSDQKSDRHAGVYYDKQTNWIDEQLALRAILLDSPLVETFKWRGAVYTIQDRNICGIGPLKAGASLAFFAGELLDDPDGLLTPVGPNSRSAMRMVFTSVDDIAKVGPAIHDFIAQAETYTAQGRKISFDPDDLDAPEELTEVLDADSELAEAFDTLTLGRKRGYYLHVGCAKRSATRTSRIQKAKPPHPNRKRLQRTIVAR